MVIAVPMVQEYISKSRKEGFTKTANGVIDAANLYYSNEAANNTSNSLEFTCTTKECKTTTNERLDIKGKPDKGTIKVFGDGEIIACFQRDTWYAVKNIGDKEAKFGEGTCEYNEETKSYDTIKLVSQEMVDNLTNQLKELQEKGDAKASEILDTKKAVVKGTEIIGTMPNNGLLNWNPTSSENKTITPGYYSGGTISTEGAYTAGYNSGKTESGKTITIPKFQAMESGSGVMTFAPNTLKSLSISGGFGYSLRITASTSGSLSNPLTGTSIKNYFNSSGECDLSGYSSYYIYLYTASYCTDLKLTFY